MDDAMTDKRARKAGPRQNVEGRSLYGQFLNVVDRFGGFDGVNPERSENGRHNETDERLRKGNEEKEIQVNHRQPVNAARYFF